jgi:hypothetical protein
VGTRLDTLQKIGAAREYNKTASGKKSAVATENHVFWADWFKMSKKKLVQYLKDMYGVGTAYARHATDFDAILEYAENEKKAQIIAKAAEEQKKKNEAAEEKQQEKKNTAAAAAATGEPTSDIELQIFALVKNPLAGSNIHAKRAEMAEWPVLERTKSYVLAELLKDSSPENARRVFATSGLDIRDAADHLIVARDILHLKEKNAKPHYILTDEIASYARPMIRRCDELFRKYLEVCEAVGGSRGVLKASKVYSFATETMDKLFLRKDAPITHSILRSMLRYHLTQLMYDAQPNTAIPEFSPLFLDNYSATQHAKILHLKKTPGADAYLMNVDKMRDYGAFESVVHFVEPELRLRFNVNWRDAAARSLHLNECHQAQLAFANYGCENADSLIGCGRENPMFKFVAEMLCCQLTYDEVRAAVWARLHHENKVDFENAMPAHTVVPDTEFLGYVRRKMMSCGGYRVNLSRIRPIESAKTNMSTGNIWSPPNFPYMYVSGHTRLLALSKMRYYLSLDTDFVFNSSERWCEAMRTDYCERDNRPWRFAHFDSKTHEYVPDVLCTRPVDQSGRTIIELLQLIEACANESHRECYARYPWTSAPEEPAHEVPYADYVRIRTAIVKQIEAAFGEKIKCGKADLDCTLQILNDAAAKNTDEFGAYDHGGKTPHVDIGGSSNTAPEVVEQEEGRMRMAYQCAGVTYFDPVYAVHTQIPGHFNTYALSIAYTVFVMGEEFFAPHFKFTAEQRLLRNLPILIEQQRTAESAEAGDKIFPRALRLAYKQMHGQLTSLIYEECVCPICLVPLHPTNDTRYGMFSACRRCFLRSEFNRRVSNVFDDTALFLERISAQCADLAERGTAFEARFGYEPAHVHVMMLKVCAERGRGVIQCDLARYYGHDRDECKYVYCRLVEVQPNEFYMRYNLDDAGDDVENSAFAGTSADHARNWWSVPATRKLPPQMVLLHSADPARVYISRVVAANRMACLHHALGEKRYAATQRAAHGLPSAAEMFESEYTAAAAAAAAAGKSNN